MDKLELQKAYLVLQENCGIKVGDTVRVLRKAKTDELGWQNEWTSEMDEAIGETTTVERIDGVGIGLKNDIFNYPFFVLEKVTHEATSSKEIAVDTTMSMRDQFAGAALTGLLDNIGYIVASGMKDAPSESTVARWAYNYADAMLKAREEQ